MHDIDLLTCLQPERDWAPDGEHAASPLEAGSAHLTAAAIEALLNVLDCIKKLTASATSGGGTPRKFLTCICQQLGGTDLAHSDLAAGNAREGGAPVDKAVCSALVCKCSETLIDVLCSLMVRTGGDDLTAQLFTVRSAELCWLVQHLRCLGDEVSVVNRAAISRAFNRLQKQPYCWSWLKIVMRSFAT